MSNFLLQRNFEQRNTEDIIHVTRNSALIMCLVFAAAFNLLYGCGHRYEDEKTGIIVRDLGSDLDNHWAFRGVVVESVRPGSPADGRISAGEVISYIVDERRVTDERSYREALREALSEDNTAVLRVLKVISANAPGDLGVGVKPDPEERGVVVSSIEPGSKAEEAGIKLETIIYQLDGKSIRSVDEYDAVVTEALADDGKITFDIARPIVAPKLSKVGIEEVEQQGGRVVVTEMEEKGSESNPAGMEGIMKGDVITHVIDEMRITDIDSYEEAIKKAADADEVTFKRAELGAIKLAAIDALGQIGDVRAVEPLLKALESEDKWIRRAAAEALEEMDDQRVIQPLMRHLLPENEPDAEVRRSAARALARMQPEQAIEAIEHLAQALKDPSLGVRLEAGYALGRIGEPAIEVLMKAMDDPDSRVRDSAIAAMGDIGGTQVRNKLIDVLRDESEESTVKLTAIQALHKIGDTESIAELRRVARTGSPELKAFVKELLAEESTS